MYHELNSAAVGKHRPKRMLRPEHDSGGRDSMITKDVGASSMVGMLMKPLPAYDKSNTDSTAEEPGRSKHDSRYSFNTSHLEGAAYKISINWFKP